MLCAFPSLHSPQVQVVLIGYPCKSISMQNNSAQSFLNESSVTGSGYKSLMSFVDYCRPVLVTAENVSSMQHSRKRFDNETPISIQNDAFARRGYMAAHELISASQFGLMQNRSRVWALYCRKEDASSQVYLGPIKLNQFKAYNKGIFGGCLLIVPLFRLVPRVYRDRWVCFFPSPRGLRLWTLSTSSSVIHTRLRNSSCRTALTQPVNVRNPTRRRSLTPS